MSRRPNVLVTRPIMQEPTRLLRRPPAALADALSAGRTFAAGLDVFEREPEVEERLLALENVVILPHLGSATFDTRDAMGMLVVENVFAALDGRRPPTLLNPDAFRG